MSPEQKQPTKIESPSEIKKGIETDFASLDLVAGEILSIDPNVKSMARCANQTEGVYQDLMLVVKAGDDFFSVVGVFAADKRSDEKEPSHTRTTVITRHRKDGRAEIVGFVEPNENPLVIGRTPDNKFAGNVSRKHFAIGISADDGHINIADMRSSNGTCIFGTTEEIEKLDSSNPVNDIDFWSVKSSELKSAIQGNS